MRQFSVFVPFFFCLGVVFPASAVDHNNIDAGHPLSFDDAESIAFEEQAFEFSAKTVFPDGQPVGGEFTLEYLNGFALNTHFSIELDSSVGGRVNSDSTQFELDSVSMTLFHNFNREYNNVPALALRSDVAIPTGEDANGLDFRLRGIASKTLEQYHRFSLNLDLEGTTASETDERSLIPGVILGYATPIGYPRQFDKTFLAEVGVRLSEKIDNGAIILTGMGLRQQVGYQRVLDFGIEGDISTDGRESRLRLILGYSGNF